MSNTITTNICLGSIFFILPNGSLAKKNDHVAYNKKFSAAKPIVLQGCHMKMDKLSFDVFNFVIF